MLGTTEEVSELLGFKSTVAYRITELDKSNSLVDIFCLEIEWLPNSRLRGKKQQINFMVMCKFHIRGGSEAHKRNGFFYSVYLKKKNLEIPC